MEEYTLKFVTADNIDQEHICCAIGNDKKNRERAETKKEWLKKQFEHGHKFLKVDVRGKVFIEYGPAEHAWFPVDAGGYNFIQCFWVSGRYKKQGLGKKLLHACEEDSKITNGLVAISTGKKAPYTVDKKFLIKQGFQKVDEAKPDFELYVKQFDQNAPLPSFKKSAVMAELGKAKGIVIYYSDMCPFNAPFVGVMAETARKRGLDVEIRKLNTAREAQSLPAAWGNCSVYLDGKFISHMAMTEKMFNDLLDAHAL